MADDKTKRGGADRTARVSRSRHVIAASLIDAPTELTQLDRRDRGEGRPGDARRPSRVLNSFYSLPVGWLELSDSAGKTCHGLRHRIRSESPDERHSELADRRRVVRQLRLRGSLPEHFCQAPDNGFCESVLFWHVRDDHYGDVKLDNLSFERVGRWEGDLWARKAAGVAGLY